MADTTTGLNSWVEYWLCHDHKSRYTARLRCRILLVPESSTILLVCYVTDKSASSLDHGWKGL